MQSDEKNQPAGPNDVAGNTGAGTPDAAAKMGPGAQNTLANSATQPETPGMKSGASAADAAPTNPQSPPAAAASQSLAAAEMSAGKGAVAGVGDQPENKEANPADLTGPARRGRKPGTPNKPKDGAPQAQTAPGDAQPSAAPRGRKPKAGADERPPDTYGGNFGNDVQTSFQDQERYQNQVSGAGRGEFGSQAAQGGTHGGYGNQYREFDFENRNSAEDRYYGGPGRYGPQHNAYRDYDGRDERYNPRYYQEGSGRDNYGPPRGPYNDHDHGGYDRHGFNERGGHYYGPNEGYDPRHAGGYGYNEPRFRDRQPDYNSAGRNQNQYEDDYRAAPRGRYNDGYDDGRGNRRDNRNQPDRDDRRSGFQNDNGAGPGRGQGYANDYGRSSIGGGDYGYGRGRDQRPDGGYNRGYANERRNQDEDYRSSRGGYDNQGSGGGAGGHRDDDGRYGQRGYGNGPDQAGRQQPGGPAQNQNADPRRQPTEGYGYGHGRDERGGPGNYRTGDQRNGYGRSYGGDSNQGYGSRGGSYNDEYDNGSGRQDGSRPSSPAQGDYTQQERNRNYGPAARQQFRPDKPAGEHDDYGSAPRRNPGREDEDQDQH